MDPKSTLRDPGVSPSAAWRALEELLGKASDYEPDTIRIELSHRGIEPSDGLMAKLLGAQTILTTSAWTYDHDVLFAFALACDGIPAAAEAFHHPTPEQLCWSVRELGRLLGRQPDDEEGFDPDTIDPAVAIVLHDEGYVWAPEELSFCQHVLDALQPDHDALRNEVKASWEPLQHAALREAEAAAEAATDDEKGIQLKRLADCRRYVAAKEEAHDRS
jgi:hypothetical protein